MKCILLLFFLTSIICNSAFGQLAKFNDYPQIGAKCPDFVLTDISSYPKKQVTLEDFKGKWLIMDFWNRGCKTCVESFPKINRLYQEFKEEITIVLIGQDDPYIRPLYDQLQEHYNLQIPIAYDTTLFNQFEIRSVPHLIWIDPFGVVRFITKTTLLNSENLTALVNGEKLDLPTKGGDRQLSNPRQPLLIDGNGGSSESFLYRSLLYKWIPKSGQFVPDFSKMNHWSRYIKDFSGIQLTGVWLSKLYDIAYVGVGSSAPWDSLYGEYARYPILELSDSSQFKFDFITGENIFCYSLILPKSKASGKNMQAIMQRDLQNYFGYEVSVGTRIMPYWSLVATNEAKERLKTKGGKPERPINGTEAMGFTLKNQPVRRLISIIFMYHQHDPLPIINETGISYNIDVTIDAVITDFDDVLSGLQKVGLDLVKKTKEMKVIVIRDSNSINN